MGELPRGQVVGPCSHLFPSVLLGHIYHRGQTLVRRGFNNVDIVCQMEYIHYGNNMDSLGTELSCFLMRIPHVQIGQAAD